MEHPRVSPAFTARELEDDLVLLRRATGEVFTLNRVAALIWYHCDGTRSEEQILSDLGALFPAVDVALLKADLARTLARFRAEGIVLPCGGAP